MTVMQAVLAMVSGGVVGFSLGLIGGGGSILAVPLLLHVVGVTDPHTAIGTGALAVSASAFGNLVDHARSGTVKWPCAAAFAAAGVLGAAIGSELGKQFDGQKLLLLFAIMMIVVAVAMLRRRPDAGDPGVRLNPRIALRLVPAGLLVGGLSGFFGIGGGFLVVPGLLFGSAMPLINAIGSSLLSVGAFGLTTAFNYARSGLIDWPVAATFIGGGVLGGLLGMRLAVRLASRRRALTYVFASVIGTVAIYLVYRNAGAFL